MAQAPVVVSTSPSHYATNVATNAVITADVSVDLDSQYLQDYVYLTNAAGVRIDGTVTYRKRKIVFTPSQPLEPRTTYQFFIIGDSNLTDGKTYGIRNIIGEPMRGNFTISFTTEDAQALVSPKLTAPAMDTIVKALPTFQWDAVAEAREYAFRLSKSNQFTTVLYETTTTTTSVLPAITLEDGLYYWSVRAIAVTETASSEWSSPSSFYLQTIEEKPIVEEDEVDLDIEYTEMVDDTLELIEVYPPSDSLGIDTKTQSLYFRVLGDVNVSDIDPDSFELIGTHIQEDGQATSHGRVPGRIHVVEKLGTVYLIFTPDPIVKPAFTLRFDKPVPGLTESDIVIQTLSGTVVTPDAIRETNDGKEYAVEGMFASGNYTVTITKPGYSFGSIFAVLSSQTQVINVTVVTS
jgi:hypothetical protein